MMKVGDITLQNTEGLCKTPDLRPASLRKPGIFPTGILTPDGQRQYEFLIWFPAASRPAQHYSHRVSRLYHRSIYLTTRKSVQITRCRSSFSRAFKNYHPPRLLHITPQTRREFSKVYYDDSSFTINAKRLGRKFL